MKRTLSILMLAVLSACDFAPAYAPPALPDEKAFKEYGPWTEARPQDDMPRGPWWTIFNDSQLNALEDDVTKANQNLKIAVAQYDEARAAASAARTAYFPTVTGDASVSRQRVSRTVANSPSHPTYNDYTVGADLSYEIDLWGRVRNTVAANEDLAAASAADLAGVALSLHAELASDYFALRGDDEAQDILDQAVHDYQEALDLTRQRFEGGVSPEADVDQAETQLENAKAEAADMRLQRAELEHAIAVLTGKAPADFALAPGALDVATPSIRPDLPSSLLERRPDIAGAERRAAAANAEIGVARAAYFPAISLTGALGFESASPTRLFSAPSFLWSMGPSAAVTLFDAGNLGYLTDEARANYEAAAANYRQTVLSAYQEVEDNLAALHHLHDEAEAQFAAKSAADRALAQANNRYTGGAATYLDVVVVQNLDLQAQLAVVNTRVRQLTADIILIRALGGGWQNPTTEKN